MIEPFEICSIRPPTENFSLTFRLTRNCGWNRCLFCPVYKQGAKFSRRSLDEIKRDVDRAKAIDDHLMQAMVDSPGQDIFQAAGDLVRQVLRDRRSTGDTPHANKTGGDRSAPDNWFSSWFKDKPTIEDSVQHVAAWRYYGGNTCFLGDSNSLILKPDFFRDAVSYIRHIFPELKRFTIYGRTKSAAGMTLDDLGVFRDAGLDRIHFGLESGCDEVLAFMKKGVTGGEHIAGCTKTIEAGISCGVYVMPGLGGAQWSEKHAHDTARVISLSSPDYVRLRTLEIFPGTRLADAVREGTFAEASEDTVVKEIRTLVGEIDTDTEIVSDSASNLLDVSGRLPGDRLRMISVIDEYLGLSPRERLEFSLASRLQSFVGQYGGVTQEIMRAIMPFISGNSIDLGRAPDEDVIRAIRLIRSRLMP
jgi:radical SAM superfamily enzyme YgiQ (UPF0313 family)